jgi:hypothetical protein
MEASDTGELSLPGFRVNLDGAKQRYGPPELQTISLLAHSHSHREMVYVLPPCPPPRHPAHHAVWFLIVDTTAPAQRHNTNLISRLGNDDDNKDPNASNYPRDQWSPSIWACTWVPT